MWPLIIGKHHYKQEHKTVGSHSPFAKDAVTAITSRTPISTADTLAITLETQDFI